MPQKLTSHRPIRRNAVRLPSQACEGSVGHDQTQVENALPMSKRFLDCALLSIRVVVVLDKVTDEPSVLGLLGEERAETEGVEESPGKGVGDVSNEEGG